MKRLLALVCFVLTMFTSTCFAEKVEYFEPNYNFKNIQKVFLEFSYKPEPDGVTEKLAESIFEEQVNKDLLVPGKLKNATVTIDGNQKESSDLQVKVELCAFAVDTHYEEGHMETMPCFRTAYCLTRGGHVAFVDVPTVEHYYIPGHNVTVAHCVVNFYGVDTKTGKIVWKRIDDACRVVDGDLVNKGKAIFRKCISSFDKDLKKKLKK
ncbi:MAG: arpin [Phascolarctobacterium sp.]|nr:arpin [Phascolarctobacterium sp.]